MRRQTDVLILGNGAAGSSAAFIGKSGTGKTTLMNLILGLYSKQGGEILIDGVDVDALEKFKRNRPQHRTKGGGRKKNVHGVYRLIRKDVAGKHVLLVDDIITTGFTLGECARMLAKGGCRRVTCAVVCTVTTERQEDEEDDW